MKPLKILKENFAIKLTGSISDNLTRYKRDKPWPAEFAGSSSWEFETGLVPAEALELAMPDGDNLKDVENAIRMHCALPSLTPVQARDPRLWTHLTHVELWEYMRRRWPVEKHLSNKQRARNIIESRYFVARNESRALLRNGAARLWWLAKLSHDESRDNPYELTGILLSTLDITQQILERSLGRAPAIVHGFLEFLQINPELLVGGNLSRERIRQLAKFLNLNGGVCLLDCLSDTGVIAMLQGEYDQIRAQDAAASV
jgi:hypothetical protein